MLKDILKGLISKKSSEDSSDRYLDAFSIKEILGSDDPNDFVESPGNFAKLTKGLMPGDRDVYVGGHKVYFAPKGADPTDAVRELKKIEEEYLKKLERHKVPRDRYHELGL